MNRWTRNLIGSLILAAISLATILLGNIGGVIVWALPLTMFVVSFLMNTFLWDRMRNKEAD